jgi:hypothetical protein
MKAIFSLLFFTFTSLVLLSQEATIDNKVKFFRDKEIGKFEFKLPVDSKKEAVDQFAKYYVNYFTVDFSEITKIAKISLVENTQENRKIIMRFLGANQIQHVIIDNRSYTLMDFNNNYLQ